MGLALYVLVIIFPPRLTVTKERKTHVKIQLFPEMSVFKIALYLFKSKYFYLHL